MDDNNDNISKKSSKKSMKLGVLTSLNSNNKIEEMESDIVNTASKENVVNKNNNNTNTITNNQIISTGLMSDRQLNNENNLKQTISKLVYRIIYCSSEYPSNPSYELLKGSQSNSWISDRFCVFPQEIYLKFISPINVSQINILSHENKISSRIDIFSFNPNNSFEIIDIKELSKTKFNYVGYIKFADNERTFFKARELKKVQLNVNCLYLKFQIHSNHINKLNLFNQVSIFSIDCYGRSIRFEDEVKDNKIESLGINNINPIEISPNLYANNLSSSISNMDDKFDDLSREKIKNYKEKIQEALKIEDYDEASKLKVYVDKIRTIGKKLLDIETQKKEFILNEDFNSCKFLKVESDRLKVMLNNIEQKSNLNENQSYNTLNNQKEVNYESKYNDEIFNNNDKFINNVNNDNIASNTEFRKSFTNDQKFGKSSDSYHSLKDINNNYNKTTEKKLAGFNDKVIKYDETVS
jgi:hypothetical protein